MSEAAQIATRAVALVFITTSMASAGMAVAPREAIGQARRWRLVGVALGTNFVLAPLIAWLLSRIIPIHEDYATGLLLISGCAGVPLLPKLAERAHGSVPFAIVMMLLLVAGTVVYAPVVMPRLIPGLHASPWEIAYPLLVLILTPLAGGLMLRTVRPRAAAQVVPFLRHASDAFLLLFIGIVVLGHLGALWSALGSGAILAALLFVLLTGAAAFALGRSDTATRRVLAMGSAQRNVAAAVIVAGNSFADRPRVMVMVLVTEVVAILVLVAAVVTLRRSDGRRTPAATPPELTPGIVAPDAIVGRGHG